MEFRIRSNGSVVDYESLRAAFPNNFIAASPTAAYLGDLGVDLVVETFAPVITDLQLALRAGVEKDAHGVWVYAWQVVPRFANSADQLKYQTALLVHRRADLHEAVAAKRQAVQETGCTYTFPEGLRGTIQTRDDRDLANITGQTMAAMILQARAVTSPVLSFRDEQNVTHMMTPSQMIDMGMASSAFISASYTAKWVHDEAIDEWDGATPYDMLSGWPA
jgi:hypothetical protein